jgi:signal transduction histidine kinase
MGIIAKRVTLHKRLSFEQQENENLRMQVNQLQPLANIGLFCGMIAHEINNILTPIGSYAQLAMKNPDDSALTNKALQKADKNCRRAGDILESLAALLNGEKVDKKLSRVKLLFEEVLNCLARDFSKDNIVLEINIPDELTVWAVPVQIEQVLMNLVINAREAMLGRGGVLSITAEETLETVVIEVGDSGCGIKPENLGLIFEPFFSTKAEDSLIGRRGRGLGLAFCKEIVERHNGFISVESEVSRGTAFRIMLPKPESAKAEN